MKFSELFNLKVSSTDHWFDPILTLDTRLFIDPFLVYASEFGPFVGSHKEIINFFNFQFKQIARSAGNRQSLLWRRAVQDMVFHEPEELCLGYTDAGTRGSGSGIMLARVIVEGLWEAIQAGLKELTHFEEIGIIRENIGADRISDITANILRGRLADYTQRVCKKLGVELNPVNYIRGRFDLKTKNWTPTHVNLPRNPYSKKPVLLVPKRYLRDLPTIDAYDFWEYCYVNENQTLRDEFSQDVTSRIDKRTIIEFARRHSGFRRDYLSNLETQKANPYDLDHDQAGLYRWYQETKDYCGNHPKTLTFHEDNTFHAFVDQLIQTYAHYVEQNKGWRLLWNDNRTPRREAASQDLFLGVVKHYCKANDIDVSREADIGRGPVDFKVSSGFRCRALIEVKKADNSKFWNGLTRQLPAYQKAEEVKIGHFLAIVYNDQDLQRVKNINSQVAQLKKSLKYEAILHVVDARYGPTSASKL